MLEDTKLNNIAINKNYRDGILLVNFNSIGNTDQRSFTFYFSF